MTWLQISKFERDLYLRGKRHPQKDRVALIGNEIPASKCVWDHGIWQSFDLGVDPEYLRRAVEFRIREEKLQAILADMLSGKHYEHAGDLNDLDLTANFVEWIRYLGIQHRRDDAFKACRVLIQLLCYHAVNPRFCTAIPFIYRLASDVALHDQRLGDVTIGVNDRSFLAFTGLLRDRLFDAQQAFRRISDLIEIPAVRWETIVDHTHDVICGFTNPDGIDHMISSLEWWARRYNSPLPSELDQDKHPLFTYSTPRKTP